MQTDEPLGLHCLPLFHSGILIGVLQLALTAGTRLSEETEHILDDLSPVIASAISIFTLRNAFSLKSQANDYERKQISHDLHDILGQDLAYLKYKLEALGKERFNDPPGGNRPDA